MSWPSPETLLPHGPRARCVDTIVTFEPGVHLIAEMRVRPSLVLYNDADGGIPAWGGIEIMAQAAGLYQGLLGRAQGLGRPRAGYLVGVRGFHTQCVRYDAEALLRVEAQCRIADPGGLARFNCRILSGGRELTVATLSVLRVADEMEKR